MSNLRNTTPEFQLIHGNNVQVLGTIVQRTLAMYPIHSPVHPNQPHNHLHWSSQPRLHYEEVRFARIAEPYLGTQMESPESLWLKQNKCSSLIRRVILYL